VAAMKHRTARLTVALVLALSVGGAFMPANRAAAAGTLSASWATTITVGAGSGSASTVSGQPLAGATVADLFGDGRKQVVVGFMDGSVSVLDGTTGAELPGWPQYTHGAMHTNPSVADLNNDGHQEVIATSEAGRIYVWNADGSAFAGWPQHTNPPGPGVNPGLFGGVAVGDLFGDGNKELVAAAWDQQLYAWNKNGALLNGFPIHVYDTAFDTPTLVDLEHTGQLDIVVGFDSSGPPYDPYPSGGEMWAFRPTGCPVGRYPNQSNCQIPGWPKTFDQVPWSSPAAADLFNNGQTEIITGTGFNFAAPRGKYENAWTASGGSFGNWPKGTAGQNMASPAVGDLFANGQREVVQLSSNGSLYAWDGNGNALAGWPVTLGTNISNPVIAPISSTQNGVWIIDGATLKAFNSAGQIAWTASGLDWGGFAAPAIADLGSGQLSAVTVDQASQSAFHSWTVRAFPIPGVSKMLSGAWPTFHGNAQLTGTLLPSATLAAMSPTQNNTAMTVTWTLDANSVPATSYTLWVRDHSGSWAIYGRTSATSMSFYGYPGHAYDFAIQAGESEPSLSVGTLSTAFSAAAAWSTPFKEMYAVDGHGLLHAGSSAPIASSSSWPGWDIIRGLALAPGGQGGYLLDGFGGLHPFGNAPPITSGPYWGGWDIARGIALRADGHSGYVLDGWGGLHPFGTTGDVPPNVNVSGFWSGWDIARDVQLRPDGQSGYVLDGWGGLHPFGATNDMATNVQTTGWWQGWDIAHRFTLDSAGTGGYVLDGWGGLHEFGAPGGVPPTASPTAYWSGWDIARGIALIPGSTTQGYVVDGYGGMHPFGGALSVTAEMFTPGGIIKQLAIS
jgi:hypothetical protein